MKGLRNLSFRGAGGAEGFGVAGEGGDDVVEVAGQDFGQVVPRLFEPMIGNTIL